MMNIIEIDGEKAVVAFDPDIRMFRGEFVGLNGGADFYAETVEQLYEEGRTSLAAFLALCAEKGIAPRRTFSGRFNVRLDPADHEAAVVAASAQGKSLNEWVAAAIRDAADNAA
ncbi:type II toxin-antitoxin system HicB family antitoxin [Azorhizobium caulinodans]|nr:type II toxin-antitoxin system HicB family antitoxin [Azorhizobium caulinodans]